MRASESRLIAALLARVILLAPLSLSERRDYLQSIFATVRALALHQGGLSSIPIRTRRYMLVEFVGLRGRLPVMYLSAHFFPRLRVIPNFGERQTSERDTRSRARLGGHDARGACSNFRCSPRVARPPNLALRLYFARCLIFRGN